MSDAPREGNLEAPTRHALDWRNPDFYDQTLVDAELERVFDHCHGCRRCVSLCDAFPTLFDLVDESETLEVDGVAKNDYKKVVDECYLCDLCFMTKCPYTPPHEWNIDFPHLMLRAKAANFKKNGAGLRDKMLSSTDFIGSIVAKPGIAPVVNAVNRTTPARMALEKIFGIAADAWVPSYNSNNLRKQLKSKRNLKSDSIAAGATKGKIALFTTCYCNYSEPGIGTDLVAVFEHNDIPVTITAKEQCCGMPKLELGDLNSVASAKEANIPVLAKLVDDGWDIVMPVPSCALMFRQELPLMFPEDEDVQKVAAAIFDPFEYLMIRHKHSLLKTDFPNPLGKVTYHAACHQRVQNVGRKTLETLSLIPDTDVTIIERCSGHDGTYA
ncbi:MAG: hypothetical protein K8F25_19480, partial [Fimbriimonadaceae bacterium]|nr:hypothetical protein [Alphaproteobacteria bacterium]